MEFDLQNMIRALEEVDTKMNDADFFNYILDPIIVDLNLKKGEERLKFDETRISKVMNRVEPLYARLSNAVLDKEDEVRRSISKDFDDKISMILRGVSFDDAIEKLIRLMNEDVNFDETIKKKILSGDLSKEDVFIEFLSLPLKKRTNVEHFKRNTNLLQADL